VFGIFQLSRIRKNIKIAKNVPNNKPVLSF
jgi:hypothetical protein